MGDIRNELLKAGLITERAARDIHRARRVEKRHAPQPSAPQEDAAPAPPPEAPAGASEPRELIRRGLVSPSPGNKRFHYVDRGGRIPFLELGEDAIRGLSNGALAIVESCGASPEDVVVVTAETARMLAQRAPDAIRFWNGR